MTSVVSLQSLILDIPPSCIEFCPAAPQYFVVGTYFLEKKEQNVSHPESEVDEVPKEDQKRTGSLILFRLIGEEVEKIDVLATPYAILDIHFSPHDPTLLCAAASTGLLALFRLNTTTNRLTPAQTLQTDDLATLVLSLAWHPTDPSKIGITLSSGAVKTVILPPSKSHPEDESATTPIQTHDLEAWTLSFSADGSSVFSGGDDATLRFSGPQGRWSDRKAHGAGVTAILPLVGEDDVTVTGSYDDRIRVLGTPLVGRKQVLAEEDLGGGVWRLKMLREEVGEVRYIVLASCMHAGARIVEIRKDGDGQWQIEVLAKFEEHKSMNYGSDVQPGAGTLKTIISTSFYDKLLCLWRYELR